MKTLGWTYEDLRSLPEDGRRYEILDGFLIQEPSPSTRHETVVTHLVGLLWNALTPEERDGLFVSRAAVVFDKENTLQPDVVYVRPHRRPAIIRDDALYGAPDLIIEVLSPSTRDRDLTAKRSIYARYGVREYWVVDPDRRAIMVFTDPRDGRYHSTREITSGSAASSVVPRFVLRCMELFDPYG